MSIQTIIIQLIYCKRNFKINWNAQYCILMQFTRYGRWCKEEFYYLRVICNMFLIKYAILNHVNSDIRVSANECQLLVHLSHAKFNISKLISKIFNTEYSIIAKHNVFIKKSFTVDLMSLRRYRINQKIRSCFSLAWKACRKKWAILHDTIYFSYNMRQNYTTQTRCIQIL